MGTTDCLLLLLNSADSWQAPINSQAVDSALRWHQQVNHSCSSGMLNGHVCVHTQGMIHRDVKPENILLTTSYQIKLADFGLSIHSNYEVANTRCASCEDLSMHMRCHMHSLLYAFYTRA